MSARLTGFSSAAQNKVGVKELLHTSNMGWGKIGISEY